MLISKLLIKSPSWGQPKFISVDSPVKTFILAEGADVTCSGSQNIGIIQLFVTFPDGTRKHLWEVVKQVMNLPEDFKLTGPKLHDPRSLTIAELLK